MNEDKKRRAIADVRVLLENFFRNTTDAQNLTEAITMLGQQTEIMQSTLATLLNYLALQQSVVRALMAIDRVTEPSSIQEASEGKLSHILYAILSPQVTLLTKNLSGVIAANAKMTSYLEKNPNITDLVGKLTGMVEINQSLLDLMGFDEMTGSRLEKALELLSKGNETQSLQILDELLSK